jgi:hypothetical protein
MPYLKQTDRTKLDHITAQVVMSVLHHPGYLNYLFCQLALQYLKCQGESYETYNSIIGALECAKLELYRRKCADYEDKKIKENGEAL